MTDAIKTDGQGNYFTRDPRSRLPISADWSAWLAHEGTSIQSSTWTTDAGGLTLETPATTATVASVIVSGGTTGTTYVVRNTITCANGVIDSRSLRVVCRDR